MSQTVSCAGCQTVLRVPGNCTDRWLTCPRCLATVENPVAAAPPVVPAGDHCPGCGKALEPTWRFCPYCNSSTAPTRSTPRRPADADVRLDTGLIGVGLVILGLLGAAAIFFGTFTSVQGPKSSRKATDIAEIGMVGLGAELVLLLAVVIGIVLTSTSRNLGFKIGGAIAGTLTIVALVMVLLCSGFILLFATCFGT
ncbi:MAG: zinc ribbon domain-containing protein [Planctomycetia bacterium]|nr:zinc ribbon domain-containing protein [Planctomycetia bacterium]